MEGNHITIAAKFSGRVQELLAWEEDLVKQGQVLVRIWLIEKTDCRQ